MLSHIEQHQSEQMKKTLSVLPDEIFEKVLDYIPPKEIPTLLVTDKLTKQSLFKTRQFNTSHNIHHGFCDQSNFINPDKEETRDWHFWKSILTKDNRIVTACTDTITLWDSENEKRIWNIKLEGIHISSGKVWLHDDIIICAGMIDRTKSIFAFDFNTGKEKFRIIEPLLQRSSVNVIDGEIVSKLNNGTIQFWDAASGKLLNTYHAAITDYKIGCATDDYSALLVTKNYIFDSISQKLIISDRKKNENSYFTLPALLIDITPYKDKFLICRLSSMFTDSTPDMMIIDLETKKYIAQFKRIFSGRSVRSVACSDKNIFAIHEDGDVYYADIHSGEYKRLTEESYSPYKIWLYENYLFLTKTKFKNCDSCCNPVDIWDIRLLKKIGSITHLDILDIHYRDGVFLASCQNDTTNEPSLVKLNFNVTHQKKYDLSQSMQEHKEVSFKL